MRPGPLRATLPIAVLLAAHLAHAQSPTCPQSKEDAAEDAVDHLSSWPAVIAFWHRYSGCDEGSITEASSDAVARLLAHRWTTLPQAAPELHWHPDFRRFVLSRMNTTLDAPDLEAVARSARTTCPNGLDAFCRDLATAASDAARRQETSSHD